jgi:N-acetylglucosaminyl-diphospho-decaprenol L-rhamnosyltransferase
MRTRRVSPIQSMSDLKLAIIIVTYNSASVLPGLLDSFDSGLEGVKEFETIVVDNDSTDNSVDTALDHAIRPRLIKMGRNAGYAAGINAAAATVPAHADLLILNPDIRLLPGTVRPLLDRLNDSSVGVAVPRILAEDGTTQWSLRQEPSLLTAWSDAILGGTFAARIGLGETIGDPATYETDNSTDWATGAILAIAARTRRLVGDWDESFFLYMEEVEYLRRVRECGFSVAYIPQAQAIHIGGEYSENPRLSALLCANRIRYHRRYHGPLSTALFRLSVLVGEGIRAIYGPPGHKAAFRAAAARWKPPPEYQPESTCRDSLNTFERDVKPVQSSCAIRSERF